VYRIATIVLAWWLCLAAGIVAQVEPSDLPDTPAGKLARLWLEAFNSGDEAAWQEFIDNRWKPSEDSSVIARRLDFFRIIYGETGGVKVVKIGEASDYRINIVVRNRDEAKSAVWLDISFVADSVAPHKLEMIRAENIDDPAFDVPDRKMDRDEIVDFIDNYIDQMVTDDLFSGAVLVAKNGLPLYTRVEGEACKRYGVPNRLDTKFNLGSMNKMFTGVAIMQLVEGGQLSLDDKVGKYLPDIPRPEIAQKVTIHHLLTHTSGMQDYWDELFTAEWWKIKTVDQMAELIFDDSLLFEPGDDFHYSNSGPIVLGMIIEKITGQSYFDYVRENIYNPAGMKNSGCYEVDRPVPNLAIGYTYVDYDGTVHPDEGWRNNLFLHAVKGGPAGGGYSTVEDLLAFDIALRNNKLISEESFDLMTTGKVDRFENTAYAYLFQDMEFGGQRIVGHGGGAPGINSVLDIYLDSGYTVAVMANYDRAAGKVARKLRELLTR